VTWYIDCLCGVGDGLRTISAEVGVAGVSETEEVQSAWGRIVRWLAANAPVSARALSAPATDEDIAGLRERLGFEVPEALEAWLRMNNGSTAKDSTAPRPDGGTQLIPHRDSAIFPFGKVFLGCEGIARQRAWYLRMAAEAGDEDYWKPSWLPVIEMSDAPYGYAIEASGHAKSPVWQYVEGGLPKVEAPSLSALLGSFADALENDDCEGGPALVVDGRLVWED
jgi:cell wall assembly regulator SMI1